MLARLGQGGMGVVYQARHVASGRLVAIKRLLEPLDPSDVELARFQAEADALSRLRHPNVVTVYDIGREDGRSWLAMELVEGQALRTRLREGALAVSSGSSSRVSRKPAR